MMVMMMMMMIIIIVIIKKIFGRTVTKKYLVNETCYLLRINSAAVK
jgi:hypothetical protein